MMFWTRKKVGQSGAQAVKVLAGNDIRAQAMANARAAREALGDETVRKIAEILRKNQQSEPIRARDKIRQTDPARVADEIILMLDEDVR